MLLKMIATIFTIIYHVMIYGFVTMKLWSWFAVPVFDLPHITLWMAVGLTSMVSAIYPISIMPSNDSEVDPHFRSIASFLILVKPFLLLLVGYIAKELAGIETGPLF